MSRRVFARALALTLAVTAGTLVGPAGVRAAGPPSGSVSRL
ncbi:hypothetical protein [Streptomyces sp. NBC_00212]